MADGVFLLFGGCATEGVSASVGGAIDGALGPLGVPPTVGTVTHIVGSFVSGCACGGVGVPTTVGAIIVGELGVPADGVFLLFGGVAGLEGAPTTEGVSASVGGVIDGALGLLADGALLVEGG